jgi:hypothetical protein
VSKTAAKDWTVGKQAKMRLQTILAATNDSQPDAGFGASWNQPPQYQIPVDHPCFQTIVDFIQSFPELIAASEQAAV